MTTSLLRAGTLSCALLTATCLTVPAIAQTNEPAHRAVDANGVDLLSGTFPFFVTNVTAAGRSLPVPAGDRPKRKGRPAAALPDCMAEE